MKISACTFLVCLILASQQLQAALFLNETFNISWNYSSAANAVYQDAHSSFNVTFVDGASTNLGASPFNPSVNIIVDTFETVIDAQTSQVQIQILGDNAGVLANPLSPGSLASDNTPFVSSFLDLGVFNAVGDTLRPSSGPNPNQWQITSGLFGLVSTAGQAGAFPMNVDPVTGDIYTSPPEGIGLSGSFPFSSNIATLDMSTVSPSIFSNGGQFAGWIVRFEVTSVPEPSFPILSLMGGIALLRRRRT